MLPVVIKRLSSHQNNVKARNETGKVGREFEAANLCAIISCCEIGCGYKSMEHLAQGYV